MRDGCSKCSENVNVSDKEIAEQIKKVIESGVPLADEKLYNKRLNVCYVCERLAYGTTCMSCGCIVRVRALYALRICPHESGSKW
ncbi:MAG TPA: DUF6171 family protein [Clostridia bacterium]